MEEEQRIVTVMGQALKRGGQASEELVDRVRTAARVMGEVEATLVIPTGGDPANKGVTEAEVMRGLLIEMGIDAEKIILESAAGSTLQNAVYVMRMVQERLETNKVKKTKVIVVTSAYHLPYTGWLFRQVTAAMNLDIEIGMVAATGTGAYNFYNVNVMIGRLKAKKAFSYDQKIRQALQKNGVTIGDDFKFENIDDILQETSSLRANRQKQTNK